MNTILTPDGHSTDFAKWVRETVSDLIYIAHVVCDTNSDYARVSSLFAIFDNAGLREVGLSSYEDFTNRQHTMLMREACKLFLEQTESFVQ